MASLELVDGPLAGRQYEVVGEIVIGRRAADVSLTDPEVSRRHAAVRPLMDAMEIRDLGSTNGTWVNGVRIEDPTALRDGDVVRIGRRSFRVHVEPDVDHTVVQERPPSRAATVVSKAPPMPPGALPPLPGVDALPTRTREQVAAVPSLSQGPPPSGSPVALPVPQPPALPTAEAAGTRRPRRRAPASRRLMPMVLSIGAVVGTAVALLLYFALR